MPVGFCGSGAGICAWASTPTTPIKPTMNGNPHRMINRRASLVRINLTELCRIKPYYGACSRLVVPRPS